MLCRSPRSARRVLARTRPWRLAERLRTMLPVRILPRPGAPLHYRQHLIWHERAHRDPGSLAFRELVSQVMRSPWQPALRSTHRRTPKT
jgi:DNA-binding transcriptional LysR family regulator